MNKNANRVKGVSAIDFRKHAQKFELQSSVHLNFFGNPQRYNRERIRIQLTMRESDYLTCLKTRSSKNEIFGEENRGVVAARERSSYPSRVFEIIPGRYLMINRYTFTQADA